MIEFTFDKDRNGKIPSGIYGDAFEMTIKACLHRKNYDRVSPAGHADFRYKKNYDVKQNATPIKYGELSNNYISGSSRVIYATHVAYEFTAETEKTVTIAIDLGNTDMWVVEKNAFVQFLLTTKGMVKHNPTRQQVNIQTIYNYSKGAYHGRKWQELTAWLDENRLFDDSIIDDILDGYYSL